MGRGCYLAEFDLSADHNDNSDVVVPHSTPKVEHSVGERSLSSYVAGVAWRTLKIDAVVA